MKIRVTQKHIDSSLRRNPIADPVANALRAAGMRLPWVARESMSFILNGEVLEFPTPPVVAEWIDAHDAGQVVQPIEFELDFEVQP